MTAYCKNTDCEHNDDSYEDNCSASEERCNNCQDAEWSDEERFNPRARMGRDLIPSPEGEQEGRKMKKRYYEIQVKTDGRFEAINFKPAHNFFESRVEAETKMQEYKKQFPHRITTRVRIV